MDDPGWGFSYFFYFILSVENAIVKKIEIIKIKIVFKINFNLLINLNNPFKQFFFNSIFFVYGIKV